jgi:hypothetical protein
MPAEFTIQSAKYHQPAVFISFNFMALFLLKVLLQGLPSEASANAFYRDKNLRKSKCNRVRISVV